MYTKTPRMSIKKEFEKKIKKNGTSVMFLFSTYPEWDKLYIIFKYKKELVSQNKKNHNSWLIFYQL